MSEKLQFKTLNVGKVAKRKSSSPAPSSKNSLTCGFVKVKMSPNNKLQLFRHFPIQQLPLEPPDHPPSTHTNNNTPSGPNTHFHAFGPTPTRGAWHHPRTPRARHQHHTRARHQHHTRARHHPRTPRARRHPRITPAPSTIPTRTPHTQCRAARTPSGSFPHLVLMCLWINRPPAESYSQVQATHIPPSSFNCENGREPGCVAESLYPSLYFRHIS